MRIFASGIFLVHWFDITIKPIFYGTLERNLVGGGLKID
jgi:hypothetical protein